MGRNKMSRLLSAWADACGRAGGCGRKCGQSRRCPSFSVAELAQHLVPAAPSLRVCGESVGEALSDVAELDDEGVLERFCAAHGRSGSLPLFSVEKGGATYRGVFGLAHSVVCAALRQDMLVFACEEESGTSFYTRCCPARTNPAPSNALRRLVASERFWDCIEGARVAFDEAAGAPAPRPAGAAPLFSRVADCLERLREEECADASALVGRLLERRALESARERDRAVACLKARAFAFSLLVFWALVPAERAEREVALFHADAARAEAFAEEPGSVVSAKAERKKEQEEKVPSLAATYRMLEWAFSAPKGSHKDNGNPIEPGNSLSCFLRSWQDSSGGCMREHVANHLFPFTSYEIALGRRTADAYSKCLSNDREARVSQFAYCQGFALGLDEPSSVHVQRAAAERLALGLLEQESVAFYCSSGERALMRGPNLLRRLVFDPEAFDAFVARAETGLRACFARVHGAADQIATHCKASQEEIANEDAWRSERFVAPYYAVLNGAVARTGLFAYLMRLAIFEEGFSAPVASIDASPTLPDQVRGGGFGSRQCLGRLELFEINPHEGREPLHCTVIRMDQRNRLGIGGRGMAHGETEASLGAASDNDIRIDGRASVSRHHLRFRFDGWWVVQEAPVIGANGEVRGSRNGTVIERLVPVRGEEAARLAGGEARPAEAFMRRTLVPVDHMHPVRLKDKDVVHVAPGRKGGVPVLRENDPQMLQLLVRIF